MTPRPRRLDHVGVFVSDLERTRAFLEDVLGLELAERDEDEHFRIVELKRGDAEVHLFEAKSGPTKPHVNHLAFEVERERFDAFLDHLRWRRVAFSGPHRFKDTKFVKFEDPDGLTWECICKDVR